MYTLCHYNTELSLLGSLEYAAKGLAKGIAVVGSFLGGGVLGGKFGALYGGSIACNATKHWTDGVEVYHCNACGRNF